MTVFDHLFNAQWTIGDQTLFWREIVGNLFGLASALGGMRRKVWAWPVGIVGNVLLFTVFLGTVFGLPDKANLLGQAGRQVMFIIVSIYGWVTWHRTRAAGGGRGEAVVPRWASPRQRVLLGVTLVAGTAILTPIFTRLGSFPPQWADAWIFVGSVLATYGMARGWVEFWLIWVLVDVVGVPLLFRAQYYASGLMYLFYGVFTIVGFFVWWRANTREKAREHLVPEAR